MSKNNYLEEDLNFIVDYIRRSKLVGSTILITGATGLIGSLIVSAISKYNKDNDKKITVYAQARNEEKVKNTFKQTLYNIELIYQDISKSFDIDCNFDYIIHTACPTQSAYLVSHPVEVINAIVNGTLNVLTFAKNQNVKGMVYLSSMEVYGQIYEDKKLNEKDLGYIDITNPRSCYPQGKRMAEQLCTSFAIEYGVNVKIARLAQVFGAGTSKNDSRVFAQFARSVINGKDIILHTTGESVGNYCYTADAIRAILLLLENGNKGESYNVVNEQSTMMIKDMACLVAKEFSNGKSKVIFDIPQNNVYGYAPPTKMHLSGQKLIALGWQPTVSLTQTYARIIDSFKGE